MISGSDGKQKITFKSSVIDVISQLIYTDLFYLYLRNLFVAVANEQLHKLREYSILRDAITKDVDERVDYS